MATAQQNRDFANDLLPNDPLNTAIEWIEATLSPEDVFDATALVAWAEKNGYVKAAGSE